MQTPFEIGSEQDRLVYIKAVDVADLPKAVQDQAGAHEHLYAVHAEDGQQLALVADYKLAFTLARQNDFQPVAVH